MAIFHQPPGDWRIFKKRQDNKNLSINELKRKYNNEKLLFENYVTNFQQIQQSLIAPKAIGVGGAKPPSRTPLLTWYASQLGAGTKDGTSEANAAEISNVPYSSMGVRDTLYLLDTITDEINIGASNIDVRGDFAGRELIHNTEVANPNSGFIWVDGGNIKMYGGTYTKGNINCMLFDGDYNLQAFNVTASDCRNNQNISLDGTGTSVWNDLTSTGASDDGVTGHDSAIVTIQGQGTNISGNGEGVAMVNTSTTIIRNCTITGNTISDVTFGVDAEDCTFGNIESRSNSNVKLNRVNVTGIIKDVGGSSDPGAVFDITNSVIGGFTFRTNAPTPASGSRGTIEQTLIKNDFDVRGALSFLKCRFLGEVDAKDGEHTFKHNFFSNEISTDHSFRPTNTILNIYYNVFKAIPNNKHVVLIDAGTTWNSNNNTYLTETLVSQRGLGSYLNITESNSIISNLDRGFWAYSSSNPISNTNLFNNAPTSGVTLNNSVSGDPLLVDIANDDFSLSNTSPAIGAGLTLTENEGIDTANWGNGVDESPIVITKLQGASWDVGAYVS
tara:strand:- start:46 stop:1716 length:1671 start_codon:yes stop_codon:yes gene_type:complete